MKTSEVQVSHSLYYRLLIIVARGLETIDSIEYVIIGWISGDADEIFEVIKLRSSKECPLLIDVIVVAVEDGKEMKKDQEFLAAWGRRVCGIVLCLSLSIDDQTNFANKFAFF